jgi:hypothetical protein
MTMGLDEARLRAENRWQSVSELPTFPAGDFSRFGELEATGRLTVGIDLSVSLELLPRLGGPVQKLFVALVVSVPYVMALVPIGTALYYRRFGFLLGLPAVAAAFVLANPLNPHRGCVTRLAMIGLLVFLVAVARGSTLLGFVSGCALATVAAVRYLYEASAMSLRMAALRSEPLFLYLYQRHLCTVRDNLDGKVYSVPREWPFGKE